jgi:uncharacterized protein
MRKSKQGISPDNNPMAPKKKSAKLLRCATCNELVTFDGEDFPFCSDRCRKIDLGKWASGVFKISSPILDPDLLEDLGAFGGGHSKSSDSHDD